MSLRRRVKNACFCSLAIFAGTPLDVAASSTDPSVEFVTAREWIQWREQRQQARALTVGGFAGLGAVSIATAAVGVSEGTVGEDPASLAAFIPVAGPLWLAASTPEPGWKAFYTIDLLMQASLLSVGIVGTVRLRRAQRALAQPTYIVFDRRLTTRLNNDSDLVRRKRLGLGLTAGGFSGFGLTYLVTVSAFVSAESETLLAGDPQVQRFWSLLPLAGPFVLAAQAERPGTRALASVLGLVQVGTLLTGSAGVLVLARRRSEGEQRVVRDVVVAPWQGAHVTGLAFSGRF